MEIKHQNILDLDNSQLRELLSSLEEPAYRADQLFSWIYKKLASSYDEMTDLPLSLRQKLSTQTTLFTLEPLEEKISADQQTRKELFKLNDGKTIESSLMLYPQKELSRERHTACISTQVGCPVKCPFCATGQQGFERNLRTGEINEQILYFMRLVRKEEPEDTRPDRHPVTNIVFMGMGEPLANYDALLKAIKILNSKQGANISPRHITISTSGLVPQILRLTEESIHTELAISLHAATDSLRNSLVPMNNRYPLKQLIPACKEYLEKTGRRPTFEYALFQGVNDSPNDARNLITLLNGLICQVNLIVGNPTENSNYIPSLMKQALAFQRQLTEGGISNTIRVPMGIDIEAGCGQLRSRWLKEQDK